MVEELARAVDDGLVASAGPRYFGFVVGGALPAAAGADWLTGAWVQNGGLHALSPAAGGAELVAGRWMLELLGLRPEASFGFPTGAGLGNTIGIAAGRHAVLAREGWDVEANGLYGAPEITVIIGDEAHATVQTSLQYLGLGRDRVLRVAADEQGRMRVDALRDTLAPVRGPVMVITQAGNVNTGGFDPVGEIADAMATRDNAWLHVDGAFGLWANASPTLRHLVDGVERADSWSTDAHKWLNVGYDCGFVAVRDEEAHRIAMAGSAAYLMRNDAEREPWEYVLDSSRRARGFTVYAAIRSLGRSGVQALVERCCALGRRMAEQLAAAPGRDDPQRCRPEPGAGSFRDDGERTRAVIAAVQEDGTAWMGGTTWQGRAAMRISVSKPECSLRYPQLRV